MDKEQRSEVGGSKAALPPIPHRNIEYRIQKKP